MVNGLCYKLIMNTKMDEFFYMGFTLNLSESLIHKPKNFMITVTSEKNSDGIIDVTYREGEEMDIETYFGLDYELLINLYLKKSEYMEHSTNCTKLQSFYDCAAFELYNANYDCLKPCTPIIFQQFKK